MHSSRMRTVRSSSRLSGWVGGGSASVHAGIQTHPPPPGPGTPGEQTPPGPGTPREQTPPPGPGTPTPQDQAHPLPQDQAHPPGVDPPGPGTPLPGPGTPSPCGQTHVCENITFTTSLRTVTRMHPSRMRTARSLLYRGVSV